MFTEGIDCKYLKDILVPLWDWFSQFQGGESDHVMCCKNVLYYMQDKTSLIKVNGQQQKILTFLT